MPEWQKRPSQRCFSLLPTATIGQDWFITAKAEPESGDLCDADHWNMLVLHSRSKILIYMWMQWRMPIAHVRTENPNDGRHWASATQKRCSATAISIQRISRANWSWKIYSNLLIKEKRNAINFSTWRMAVRWCGASALRCLQTHENEQCKCLGQHISNGSQWQMECTTRIGIKGRWATICFNNDDAIQCEGTLSPSTLHT